MNKSKFELEDLDSDETVKVQDNSFVKKPKVVEPLVEPCLDGTSKSIILDIRCRKWTENEIVNAAILAFSRLIQMRQDQLLRSYRDITNAKK